MGAFITLSWRCHTTSVERVVVWGAERGRLKPRLKGLRPPSPPARTSQNQTLPERYLVGDASLQPATAGFVAERQQRGRSGAVLTACAPLPSFPRILEKSIMAEERIPYDISPLLPLQD